MNKAAQQAMYNELNTKIAPDMLKTKEDWFDCELIEYDSSGMEVLERIDYFELWKSGKNTLYMVKYNIDVEDDVISGGEINLTNLAEWHKEKHFVKG